MRFNLRASRIVALGAAFAAQASFAATTTPPAVTLYGGGASFPANAYTGNTFLAGTPNPNRLSQTKGVVAPTDGSTVAVSDKGSLFGAFAALNPTTIGVSYCQTGSGMGRNVLIGSAQGTGSCLDYGATPTGFSATAADAHFAGSDAPFSQAEINTFGTNKSATRGQPVQVPAVAGAIAVIYNNADLGKKKLNLTRSDICGIFSGSINDWSQLTHTPKVTIPGKPIKVVYRSDSSGTTFSFTNFLTSACPTLALPGDTAVSTFKMANTFSTAFLSSNPTAGFLAASGNGGVVGLVTATDGAIGYADVADANARAKLAGGAKLTFATVSYAADQAKEAVVINPGASYTCKAGAVAKNKTTGQYEAVGTVTNTSTTKPLKYTCPAITYNKLDPAKNLIKKGATSIVVTTQSAKVLGSVSSVTGRQGLVDVTATTYPGGVLPASSCIQTVDPASYAQSSTALTKKAALDFETYPLIAVSYLMGYNAGYGTDLDEVRALFKAPFDTAVLAKTKTIGKTSGFQPLTLAGGVTNASAFVDTCIAN